MPLWLVEQLRVDMENIDLVLEAVPGRGANGQRNDPWTGRRVPLFSGETFSSRRASSL